MVKKKFINQTGMKVGIIGDEETVAGFCLAGAGMRDGNGTCNFLVVDGKTRRSEIEAAFSNFTTVRKDIGIVMINQHIAEDIRYMVREFTSSGQVIPTILEVPSKDHPYDPTKDSVMQRVQMFFGNNIDLEEEG